MKNHSYLSTKCIVKKSKLAGLGVFAKENIKRNEIIAIWGGIVYSTKEIDLLSEKYPHFATHTVSIYDDFYLGPIHPTDGLDDTEYFNHSCLPNAGVKGQIVIVARRNIQSGEEICFDYDTTETNSEGSFECKCGTKECRHTIDGSAWKDPDFQKKNSGYLSWYIQEKIHSTKLFS